MKKIVVAVIAALLAAQPASAKTDIKLPDPAIITTFTQQAFEDFSRQLGLAISYVPAAPAEPLGDILPGIDAGVEITGVKIDSKSQFWKDVERASGGDIPGILPFPKLHIQVGLPVVPVDLGVVYSAVPGTNMKYMGGELKYAIFEGSAVWPALAVRGSYTKLSGVTDLDIDTKQLDVSISKGILMFTPYAGYGRVWIDSKDKRSTPRFQEVKISENKGFIGCGFGFFPFMNLVAEADISKVNSFTLRLNLHF